MTSCSAKCLSEEDCYLAVYFPNGTCNGYGRLWVLLTEPNKNLLHAHSFVMSRMTDSVQCPNGSVHLQAAGTCFVVNYYKKTWKDALEACKANYSTPVEIETKEEGEFIATHIRDVEEFWIGATREEGTWRWASSDRKIEYTNWYPGHPKGEDNCAAIFTINAEQVWFETNCEEELQSVCYNTKVNYNYRGQLQSQRSTTTTKVTYNHGGQIKPQKSTITTDVNYNHRRQLSPQKAITTTEID
ncbi:hypothetical protein ScPMuIL_008132 [Solemya velum]